MYFNKQALYTQIVAQTEDCKRNGGTEYALALKQMLTALKKQFLTKNNTL